MSDSIDTEWDEIKAVFTNPKTPYRLWTYPHPKLTYRQQKQMVEIGVADRFCESIEVLEGRKIFRNIKTNEMDPPDIIIEKLDGSKIGVEITELLDEEIQRERVKIWRKYGHCGEKKRWTPEELINEIQKRIKQKNAYNKPEFYEGPYDSRILVIYSVESSVQLYFRNLAAIMSQQEFGPAPRFDEAYFLTVPAPMQKHPQLCKLRLKNSK
jgi:hypothetical protein